MILLHFPTLLWIIPCFHQFLLLTWFKLPLSPYIYSWELRRFLLLMVPTNLSPHLATFWLLGTSYELASSCVASDHWPCTPDRDDAHSRSSRYSFLARAFYIRRSYSFRRVLGSVPQRDNYGCIDRHQHCGSLDTCPRSWIGPLSTSEGDTSCTWLPCTAHSSISLTSQDSRNKRCTWRNCFYQSRCRLRLRLRAW